MDLYGLSPLALAGAALAASLIVTLLYLLKNEQRRVIVPSLFLWDAALGKKSSASFWTRLRRLLSLLLALAIVLSLVFAIADPRVSRKKSARAIVVLIDTSASMRARDGKPTRLADAKKLCRDDLSTLGLLDRALIAQLDAAATPLSSLSDDPAELSHAIERIEATDLTSDLTRGVRFALNVLHGTDNPEIWLYSDGNLQGVEPAQRELAAFPKVRFRYVSVGKESRNVAIKDFGVRRYPLDKSRQEALVSVKNFGSAPEVVTLTVRSGNLPLHEETFPLAAQAETTRVLSQLGANEGALQAEIRLKNKADALDADDLAYAALPTKERARVLLVSEGNRYLEAALLLDEYLEVEEVAPSQYQTASGFDVVIFDRFVPSVTPSANALYLAPDARVFGRGPLEIKGESVRPYFERVDQAHEATRHAALRDVNMARALVFAPLKADQVLAEGTRGVPLIVAGRRDDRDFIAFAFDIRESDLPLRPAWPLLLLGSIESLSHGEERAAFRQHVGTTLTLAVDAPTKNAVLTGPHGTQENLPIIDGQIRIELAQRGVYEISAGASQRTVAANVLADVEGAIAPKSEIIVKKSAAEAKAPSAFFAGKKPWLWLSMLAACLFVFEWFSFHRRWTV